ncbi:outer membrane protein [Methylobacterium sp. Leaf118]|uniref:outer membrane protein n=1 Tax=Methylobacterium sp. Leaf118 TaxID=2876562 RepID=UPI001E534C55|nr:outer membrane beta-barrel protein [Methylobacterium sp. Leaf118]
MNKVLISLAALVLLTSTASAADLPRRVDPPQFAPVPVFSWTGFYVGVNASGVVDGTFGASLLTPVNISGTASAGGYVAGGTIGYNYQFTPGNGFVIGLEGDVGYADIHNRLSVSVPGLGSASAGVETDSYFATARGRLGYAFGPALIFATGGYAASEIGVRADAAALGFAGAFSQKTSIDGYTVGGGLEYAILPNFSVKGEYLYSNLEKPFRGNVLGTDFTARAKLEVQQLKVGINYRFNLFN